MDATTTYTANTSDWLRARQQLNLAIQSVSYFDIQIAEHPLNRDDVLDLKDEEASREIQGVFVGQLVVNTQEPLVSIADEDEVKESLRHSISTHADVWAELSKR